MSPGPMTAKVMRDQRMMVRGRLLCLRTDGDCGSSTWLDRLHVFRRLDGTGFVYRRVWKRTTTAPAGSSVYTKTAYVPQVAAELRRRRRRIASRRGRLDLALPDDGDHRTGDDECLRGGPHHAASLLPWLRNG